LASTGRKPVTGPEWEFEDALSSYEKSGAANLIVYRKTAPLDPKFSGISDVRQELRELKRQWERLEAFWERYFETREGHAKRAYNPFTTADDFESKLETTLRDLLEKRVARGWRADSGPALYGPAGQAGLARLALTSDSWAGPAWSE
jgi:hypothetical protein